MPLKQESISYGGVAQLGEHLPCKQGVRSSILLISTKEIDSFYMGLELRWLERTPDKREVDGSNPFKPTINIKTMLKLSAP